jgi:hypothetical protein
MPLGVHMPVISTLKASSSEPDVTAAKLYTWNIKK